MREQELEAIVDRLSALSKVVEREKVKVQMNEKEKTRLELGIKEKREANTVLLQVVELFKELGGSHEKNLLEKLSEFLSYGLSSVFGVDYKFVPVMSAKGKDLRVDFYVECGDIRSDVVSAHGGGVAEVVSILLQLFFVVSLKGKIAPFMLLDAAMIHLSDKFHRNMSMLLKQLADELGIQIVLLAHSGEYGDFADRLYHFRQENGKTVVEKIK